LQLVIDRQQKEKDNKGLQDAVKLLEARFDLEQKIAGFRKTAADAESQQAEDNLNYKKDLGLVTTQQYAKEKADLDRARVDRETAQDRASLAKRMADQDLLNNQINALGDGGGAEYDRLFKDYTELGQLIKEQGLAIDAVEKQKQNSIDLTERLSSKMTGYSNIVKNSFESMGDALAEFARSGKLDFKSLVDQMLFDLIRFELRAQMSSLYTSMGGLGGMFTAVMAPDAKTAMSPYFTPGVSTMVAPSAKGNVFDTGLTQFAKGGMFTNSIVNQPTLFKFAKGTGMMGEAGPEAIMPLKRDNNGNLGVRSGGNGGNVDVVVNNYGNEKATTKETKDSRGNRKIEVIIGDIVAGELNRVGSNTQQAMTSNYGTAPLVARR
jgi:lambda family phage tail tape measure protein